MIQALAAEAAEEALADRVQVGRPGWDRDHVHIRACGGRGEVAPELAIVVPDQEPRCAVVRRSLSELLSDPRIGRGAGDVDVDDLAGPVGDDKERVDRAEPGVVELQDIAGPDVVRVVPEEGPPGLAVLPARTDGSHVLLDRPLAHADAELEQFAADPFGAPQPVGSGHGLDQVDELHAQPPPCPPPPGRMVPEEGEQVAMPAEEGVGLDHLEGIAPRGVQPGQEHQDKPGLSVEAWARWRRASEYEDLLAEERVLGDKRRAGPDGVDADRAHQRCPSADGPQHVRDGPATFVDASTDGRLDGPGQPVQHAGLLSHRGLGSRGRGTRFSQQRLTALRRKPLLCGWTGQVASTGVENEAGGVIRLSPARSKTLVGRILPISHPIAEALARRRARRNPDSPLVFHRDGIPIRRWRTAWRTACQAAGVPTRFLHDCRRTAARNLIRASVSERVAMLLTGHKTRAIFDRYNIINEQELLEAGDQLVEYLAQHAQATPRGARPTGTAALRTAPPLRLVRRTTA